MKHPIVPALGLAFLAGYSLVSSAFAVVNIDYVPVGNAGKAADPSTGYGLVGYVYQIGKYEVTNSQYAEFLNTVDPSGANPNGIYNASMGSEVPGGINFNSGATNGMKYTIRTNMGNKPVNYVSWYDAARFVNWLHNGQGSGSTETGAYTLTGNTGIILKNASARVWIPSENEWYKAAYFDPTKGGSGGYWSFPTKSNMAPTVATSDATGNISNSGANVSNYSGGAVWNGRENVTTVGSAGAGSAYGTYDQGGNVWEWNDAVSGSLRGLRGSSFANIGANVLMSSFRLNFDPSYEAEHFGFRVLSASGLAPQFTSAAPPSSGMVGTAYNHTCTASGSTPITFTVSAGDLPAGLSLGMGGVISGTPDAAGTFSGTLTASNGTLPDATQGFSITIAPAPVAPQFTSAAPPSSGMVGTAYNHTCTASGSMPITFTVSAGALPAGLSLGMGGVINGTPDAAGTFSGTLTASNGTLPDATQNFTISISEYHTLVAGGTHGTVTGGGSYLHGASAIITATGNPGYLFADWGGDASGSTNPLSVVMNANKTITANFIPDTNDHDGDGLTNYQEIVDYHSDPQLADTDGDGFPDGYEASLGFSPTSAESTPDAQMEALIAVEVRFSAALGQSYRIESSTDMENWTQVEAGIPGTGGRETRFYSIQSVPKRFFRAIRE